MLIVALLLGTPEVKNLYTCEGNPTGDKPYSVSLQTKQVDGNIFLVWNDGTQVGFGVRVGDQLSVAFIDRASGGVGVILYTITDGKLEGVWSAGDGKTYKETCLLPNQKKA